VIYWDCLESRALPQFVREQLIRLHRVTGQCLYAAADIVIPCNATFNTKWEVGATCQHPDSRTLVFNQGQRVQQVPYLIGR
jgi:hypothetical protein